MNLRDLNIQPLYQQSNELTETDRLISESLPKVSKRLQEFVDIFEEGKSTRKENIRTISNKFMLFLGFVRTSDNDQPTMHQTIYSKKEEGYEKIVVLLLEKKTEQISLSMQLFPYPNAQQNINSNYITKANLMNPLSTPRPPLTNLPLFRFDSNIPTHMDVFGTTSNHISAKIPALFIEIMKQTRQLKCSSSMIGQLDENYVSWFILNLDLLFLATIGLLKLFENVNLDKDVDCQELIQSAVHNIHRSVGENRSAFEDLLDNLGIQCRNQPDSTNQEDTNNINS